MLAPPHQIRVHFNNIVNKFDDIEFIFLDLIPDKIVSLFNNPVEIF